MTLCSMNACSAPDLKSGQRLRRSIAIGASAGATPRRCPDIGTMRAIRSAPSVSVVRGIARRVAWYRENPAPTETNPLL
ncbi:dTDP-glucose 4 6-dehydratase [Methylorubrum thiocyanatum]